MYSVWIEISAVTEEGWEKGQAGSQVLNLLLYEARNWSLSSTFVK